METELVSIEKERLQRLQGALFHLQRALSPFVAARMESAFGFNWRRGAATELDVLALLKTIRDKWREAFETAFNPGDARRARNFTFATLDARNHIAHPGAAITDEDALRYLDAMLQLAKLMKAPETDVAELGKYYREQRFGTTSATTDDQTSNPRASSKEKPTPFRSRVGTIEERLLAYVHDYPDLDDDELSLRLGITPRQAINQAARRLEARGVLTRTRGPRGKIVNRLR
jgi:hypothetical protein